MASRSAQPSAPGFVLNPASPRIRHPASRLCRLGAEGQIGAALPAILDQGLRIPHQQAKRP